MKNLGNDFVIVNEEMAVCVNDSKYEDFNIKEGMIVVGKSLAMNFVTSKNYILYEDVIVSYRDEDDFFVGWTKVDGKNWEKVYFYVQNGYTDLSMNLANLIKVKKWSIDKPGYELYTGDGFTIEDVEPGEKCNNGGEYGFYTNYRKTDIDGLYRVSTWCTCDFDNCCTGFQDYEWISNKVFEELRDTRGIYEYSKRAVRKDVAVRVFKELLSRQNNVK